MENRKHSTDEEEFASKSREMLLMLLREMCNINKWFQPPNKKRVNANGKTAAVLLTERPEMIFSQLNIHYHALIPSDKISFVRAFIHSCPLSHVGFIFEIYFSVANISWREGIIGDDET